MALSPKAKEQIERLKARVKSLGHKMAGGIKGSAYAVGTGAVGYYVADMAVQKVEFLQKDYVLPALLVIGGHLIKRKQYDIGTALMAIGAFLAAQTFKHNSDKGSSTTTTTTTSSSTPLGGGTTPVATGLGWNMADGGSAGSLQSAVSSPQIAATSQVPSTAGWGDGGDAGALVTQAMMLND